MTVVAFVESSKSTDAVLTFAAWACARLSAPLTLVARDESIEPEPAIAFDAYQQMDVQEDLIRELTAVKREETAESDSEAVELVQRAARLVKELGVERVRTSTTQDDPATYIQNATDYDDLIVIARSATSDSNSRPWLEQLLQVRKRMILLVPDTFIEIDSWLMAIDGGAATGRAVEFLTQSKLLREHPGKAVIVGNDYQHRLHFRDAVKHLESCGYSMTPFELHGLADDVLAAILAVSPVDLLVMGAFGQGRFKSLVERSTTSRLLKAFAGPVLLARD